VLSGLVESGHGSVSSFRVALSIVTPFCLALNLRFLISGCPTVVFRYLLRLLPNIERVVFPKFSVPHRMWPVAVNALCGYDGKALSTIVFSGTISRIASFSCTTTQGGQILDIDDIISS
jgi:hypothetical protein